MPYMLPLPNMQQAPPPLPHQSKSMSMQHQQMMRTVSISILVMSLPVLYVSFLHVPPAALFRDTVFWFLMSNSIIIVIAADSGMLFFRSSSSSSSSSRSSSTDDVGLPFVVSGAEPDADEVMVLPVENQVMVLREQHDLTTTMVSDNNDHALVLREDQGERRRHMAIEPPVPESSRVIMVKNEGISMVRANMPGLNLTSSSSSRSLSRREERLRRRHSHRPSSSHSRSLVPVEQDKSVAAAEEKQLRRAATEEKDVSEYSRLSDEELNRRVEEFITKFNMEMRLQLEREQQLALAAA